MGKKVVKKVQQVEVAKPVVKPVVDVKADKSINKTLKEVKLSKGFDKLAKRVLAEEKKEAKAAPPPTLKAVVSMTQSDAKKEPSVNNAMKVLDSLITKH